MQAADRESWQEPLAGPQRELVGAHLLLLNRLLRRLARGDLAAFAPQGDMQQRLLLAMRIARAGRVSDLAGLLGADLGQVSRAFSELGALALVERPRSRGPFVLAPAGEREADAMLAVLRTREADLLDGLDEAAIDALRRNLGKLNEQASTILQAASRDEPARDLADTDQPGIALDPARAPLQLAINNLASVISRSASIIYKRQTGLSGYEWRVLANVAARPGIAFPDLVLHIGSDKGQVSRALGSLVAGGHLLRAKGGRGAGQAITLTPQGEAVYAVLLEDSFRRNAMLLGHLPPGAAHGLMASLTRVIANTQALAAD